MGGTGNLPHFTPDKNQVSEERYKPSVVRVLVRKESIPSVGLGIVPLRR